MNTNTTNYFKATYRTHGEASKLIATFHFFNDRDVHDIERALLEAQSSADGMNETYGRLHQRIGSRVSVFRHPIMQGPWRSVLEVGEAPDMPMLPKLGERN